MEDGTEGVSSQRVNDEVDRRGCGVGDGLTVEASGGWCERRAQEVGS